MPSVERNTVGERLYWCYANLGMAEMAVHEGCAAYERKHFMVRSRLYKGLTTGAMSPRSLMRDQAIRMCLPQECIYCGVAQNLSIDHIVPTNRGGDDAGDNAIWACRSCNSSKKDKDLFEWWASREGFPPLLVVRIYLKQAIRYFESRDLLAADWRTLDSTPFSLASLPETFPVPGTLSFSPDHQRKAATDKPA
jgi:5-methylcytosine-specific restriction endonuclease McrA